jgi:choline dehydrogenase-like flavoprotein
MGNDHYDVLVIGSGPGGATTAARAAETGKRVLLLERGDLLPRERDNWNSRAVFGEAKYTADETFYDHRDWPFRPELHYYVGGNSKVYGAALLRLLPGDFGEVRHPGGVAPAWPLSYADLEPYYVRAEHLFWVLFSRRRSHRHRGQRLGPQRGFFRSVFGFGRGIRTENRGPEQADLDDVEDVHVSVTRLAPDLPAPRLELLHYHVGTRRPIPPGTVSNDIVATHCAVRVASFDATADALAGRGTPLARDDLMILPGGIRLPGVREHGPRLHTPACPGPRLRR